VKVFEIITPAELAELRVPPATPAVPASAPTK
jgi:hypothetical protein